MSVNITKEDYELIMGFEDIEKFYNYKNNCEILVCPFTNDIVALHLQLGSFSKYVLFEEAWRCVQ